MTGVGGAGLMLLLALPSSGATACAGPIVVLATGAVAGVLVARTRLFGGLGAAPGGRRPRVLSGLLAGGVAGLLLLLGGVVSANWYAADFAAQPAQVGARATRIAEATASAGTAAPTPTLEPGQTPAAPFDPNYDYGIDLLKGLSLELGIVGILLSGGVGAAAAAIAGRPRAA